MDDCLVRSHPHRVTDTKCRIDTIVSPDYEHLSPETSREKVNILRKIVHQVGFIYSIIKGCAVNKT